ncbi:hypothetical protein HC031_29860 [Planosporangium thailandense]|uniref:Uncharacterized protein n=1 Tax=Planosporangium thailandense TaxID=765197 RepID=A0ABX0Y6D6_9ACTN|nr:hypothetical protein [Planosporangium thailandense]NJC73888.1 hypothetical protein [Planosporangium thailandense]
MAAMRSGAKTARAAAIWFAATGVGIGVSWFGVRPLLDAAVPERLVAFPVSGLQTAPQTPAVPASSESRPPGTRSAAPRSGVPVSRSPSRTPQPAPSASVTASPAVPVPAGWTPTGDGRYVRTFRLTGGTATVQAGPDEVALLSATPRPGYVMTVTPAGSDPLRVTFTMILHTSALEVRWDGDAPDASVTEVP